MRIRKAVSTTLAAIGALLASVLAALLIVVTAGLFLVVRHWLRRRTATSSAAGASVRRRMNPASDAIDIVATEVPVDGERR